MATTDSPRVLVIGLDPYRVPGPWDPEPVAKAIEEGLAKFAAHGVGAETCLFGLDGSGEDMETVVGNALQAHRWECVTIGGGLRHSDDHVEHLRGRRPMDRVKHGTGRFEGAATTCLRSDHRR